MTSTPDTSVVVAALAAWHEDHHAAREALRDVEVVPAHVLIETFSVLTRLPDPHRVSATDAHSAIAALPWRVIQLPGDQVLPFVVELGHRGVVGGAVYDALIATTAAAHGGTLISNDRRAQATYERLGVAYQSA